MIHEIYALSNTKTNIVHVGVTSVTGSMSPLLHRQNGDKPTGCMSGFLHIFDRQQIQARKRIHSARRLIASTSVGLASSSESDDCSGELEKVEPEMDLVVRVPPSPCHHSQSSVSENGNGDKVSLGKCTPETSRPDSRRVSGVVARLMGLEPLKSLENQKAQPNGNTTPTLPRSNSECRGLRDPIHSKNYIDGNNFQVKQPNRFHKHLKENSSSSESSTTSQTASLRGMDEHFNDLTALKQILEVLQTKGLLHSTNHSYQDKSHSNKSSIHMKQWRSLSSKLDDHRSVNDQLKKDGVVVDWGYSFLMKPVSTSPNRIECNLKSCNSILKTKPLNIDIETSSNASFDSKGLEKRDEYADGKRLLKRCEKLVHSIAEMNNSTESPPSSAVVLPSPVSVLNSGFDKDESWSPSDSIDFKATSTVDFEDDTWTPKVSPTKHDEHEEEQQVISDDPDFNYISEILRSPQHKQSYNTENTLHDSKVTKSHKKLVFDVITEMLDKNRQLPPWKTSIGDSRTSLKNIWYEYQNIRAVIVKTGDDINLLELISGVLKKEVEVKDWGDYPIETSEVILDVERLIYKDLVSEAIGELVGFSGECVFTRTRRRLVF